MFDLSFNFKFVYRYILIHKLNKIINTYSIPFISNIFIYVSFFKIVDLDSVNIFNYIYLFKFFFGRKTFVFNYKSLFDLGKTYYTFDIGFNLGKNFLYFFIFFLSNDFLFSTANDFIKFVSKFSKLSLIDLNYFTDKKNNLGLFNLDKNLLINFYFFNPIQYVVNKIVLNFFKIC